MWIYKMWKALRDKSAFLFLFWWPDVSPVPHIQLFHFHTFLHLEFPHILISLLRNIFQTFFQLFLHLFDLDFQIVWHFGFSINFFLFFFCQLDASRISPGPCLSVWPMYSTILPLPRILTSSFLFPHLQCVNVVQHWSL